MWYNNLFYVLGFFFYYIKLFCVSKMLILKLFDFLFCLFFLCWYKGVYICSKIVVWIWNYWRVEMLLLYDFFYKIGLFGILCL